MNQCIKLPAFYGGWGFLFVLFRFASPGACRSSWDQSSNLGHNSDYTRSLTDGHQGTQNIFIDIFIWTSDAEDGVNHTFNTFPFKAPSCFMYPLILFYSQIHLSTSIPLSFFFSSLDFVFLFWPPHGIRDRI